MSSRGAPLERRAGAIAPVAPPLNPALLIGVKNVKIILNMSMNNEIHKSYNRIEIVSSDSLCKTRMH